jgi:hypothetical protein
MTAGVDAFTVVDLTPQCEIRASAGYSYALLERIDGAPRLLGQLGGAIWATPQGFDLPLGSGGLVLRWAATAEACGIATLRSAGQPLSVSVICSGTDPHADQTTLTTFQTHVCRELHDTQFEASFQVHQITTRPLLVTLGLFAPKQPADQAIFALADRCFAAAYFRRLGLV